MPADTPPVPEGRAVVDRIVDGRHAVLLSGPDGVEHTVAASSLPAEAREGSLVVITVDAALQVTVDGVDVALTQQRAVGLSERMGRIRRERSGGRFG